MVSPSTDLVLKVAGYLCLAQITASVYYIAVTKHRHLKTPLKDFLKTDPELKKAIDDNVAERKTIFLQGLFLGFAALAVGTYVNMKEKGQKGL